MSKSSPEIEYPTSRIRANANTPSVSPQEEEEEEEEDGRFRNLEIDCVRSRVLAGSTTVALGRRRKSASQSRLSIKGGRGAEVESSTGAFGAAFDRDALQKQENP